MVVLKSCVQEQLTTVIVKHAGHWYSIRQIWSTSERNYRLEQAVREAATLQVNL